MDLLLKNTLPINKDLLMLVISQTNGAKITTTTSDDFFKELDYLEINVKTPIPNTRVVGSITLSFKEFLPNTLLLTHYSIFSADENKDLNKNQQQRAMELVRKWFISDVFQKNPSRMEGICAIEAYHLNNHRNSLERSDDGVTKVYYPALQSEIEPLFEASYSLRYQGQIHQKFYFYRGCVYLQGDYFYKTQHKEFIQDEMKQTYLKVFEWDGETPLTCFTPYEDDNGFFIDLYHREKVIDFKQLLETMGQPTNSRSIAFNNDKSSKNNITVYSNRMLLTTPIPSFNVGDFVEFKKDKDAQRYNEKTLYISEKLENGYYKLLSEQSPLSYLENKLFSHAKELFLFSQFKKVENFIFNEHVGQYLIAIADEVEGIYQVHQIEEEHPNYYFFGKSEVFNFSSYKKIHKKEVVGVYPTLDEATKKLHELNHLNEQKAIDYLTNGETKVHQMLKLFLDELDDNDLKENIINYINIENSKEKATDNEVIGNSLSYAVDCLKEKYLN